VIAMIPRGRVATYGQIADLAGLPGHARQVGYALHSLGPASAVPWQRVVNAQGRSSLADGERQHARLRAEGVEIDARGRVDLRRFAWTPTIEVAGARRRRATKGRDPAAT
jgi:methylated-DNA-protein-cysteine methyltransferase related protein